MKRSWVIWTVVLVLLGGLGLTAVVIDIHRDKQQTARHKAKSGQGADIYLQQYFEWSTLPAEERIANPWGQGEYGGPQLREQLIGQQASRLRADLADLASGTTTPPAVADVLYGRDWQQEVEQYRKRCDVRDGIAILATMSILAGLIVCIGYSIHHSLQGAMAHAQEKTKDAVKKPQSGRRRGAGQDESEDDTEGHDMLSQIIASASDETSEGEEKPSPSVGVKNEPLGYFRNFGPKAGGDTTVDLKKTLRNQAVDFKPTVAEAEAGGTGALGTLMSSSPVASELTELTQEVSAIREFAAQQQDRVRQLQDGYDWGIIKRFCLRIIRCIDNLDERIAAERADDPDVQALLDVRDELVFSLESSGVEQFQPEAHSDYKGLEKVAEAVKGREPAPAAELIGKIASVVRPGYRYVVSDDDIKIVRCAQVKLYGDCS